jgi:hypothetical protein
MASFFDLAPHIAKLIAAGLVVDGEYKGSPPRWLVTALEGRDVFVVNVKGTKLGDTPCVIRLSHLEKLLAQKDGARAGDPTA